MASGVALMAGKGVASVQASEAPHTLQVPIDIARHGHPETMPVRNENRYVKSPTQDVARSGRHWVRLMAPIGVHKFLSNPVAMMMCVLPNSSRGGSVGEPCLGLALFILPLGECRCSGRLADAIFDGTFNVNLVWDL